MMDDFDDVKLTSGFFQTFISDGYPKNTQPVLQVIEFRRLPTPGVARLRLSDGLFSFGRCTASLDVFEQFERDDFADSHAIIQVTDFVRSTTSDRPLFIINGYNLLQNSNTIIGEPKPHSENPKDYKGIENFPSMQNQNGAQSPSRKRGLVDQNAATPNKRQATLPGGNVFTNGVIDISMITPYANKFRFCGAVTFKEPMRKINTKRGEMNVFSFVLTDSSGSSIKITAFGKECEKYADLVQDGQAYYVDCTGNSVVREANRRFNSTGHTYEITLNSQCTVDLCTDRDIGTPQCKLHAIPLSDVRNHANECVDILALIDKVDDIGSVTAKATQKNLQRRNITLIDDSCVQIQMTLWENDVDKITPDLVGSVLGIKGASVREYNGGFSLTVSNGSSLITSPDGGRVQALINWFVNERENAQIGSMTKTTEGSGSFERDCRTIHSINEMDLEFVERGAYFTVEGFINAFNIENIAYNACPKDGCKKKVTNESNQWLCSSCGVSDHCRPTYILNAEIADFTGLTWITLFDDSATELLGTTAEEMMDLKNQDRDAYNLVFNKLRCKPFEFRVRVKNEIYNDNKKARWTCFKITAPNTARYTKVLEKAIGELP